MSFGDMRPLLPIPVLVVLAIVLLSGCGERRGDSSASVEQSRKRGVFVAEYLVPPDAQLGGYRPIEVWAETVAPSKEQQIIIRLAWQARNLTMLGCRSRATRHMLSADDQTGIVGCTRDSRIQRSSVAKSTGPYSRLSSARRR
jgi:hypothetical protein